MTFLAKHNCINKLNCDSSYEEKQETNPFMKLMIWIFENVKYSSSFFSFLFSIQVCILTTYT